MKSFKVICKASGTTWVRDQGIGEKIVTKRFFGLIKTTKIVSCEKPVHGPSKDEICIVIDVKDTGYYKLAGYTEYGWYTPEPFIRLDEFTEGQKEIAEKTEVVLN